MLCDDLEGWGGREAKSEGVCAYIWLSQKRTQHCKAIILQIKTQNKENKIVNYPKKGGPCWSTSHSRGQICWARHVAPLPQGSHVSTTFGVRTHKSLGRWERNRSEAPAHQPSSQAPKHLMHSPWLPFYFLESGILSPSNTWTRGSGAAGVFQSSL